MKLSALPAWPATARARWPISSQRPEDSSFSGSAPAQWENAADCTGNPRAIVASGVGRIPEDRHARGMVVADMDIWENLMSEDIQLTLRCAGAGVII